MGIIIIDKGKISAFDQPDEFEYESKLQNMIEKNPNILPIDAARQGRLMTVAEEMGNDAGSADLVLIDGEGKIYLVETKLSKNVTKREVIAQLIDYAASFSNQSSEEFLEGIKAYFKAKHQVFEEELEKKYPDIISSDILDKLKHHFEAGEFTLIVAMDKVDKGIERMIDFMNNHEFWVYGYDVESYKINESQEVLVPRLIGSETAEQVSSQTRKTWDEQGFADYLEKQPVEIQKSVKELFNFARNEFHEIKYGNATVPDFKITHKMLGIESLGQGKNPDNVLLLVRADGTIYTRSDYFIKKDGKYSCKGAEHFYTNMKKALGNEIFDGWITSWDYLPFSKWGHTTQRIKEILKEVIEIGKKTV